MKKSDILAFFIFILLVVILMAVMGWMLTGAPIAPTQYKTEVVEVYEIEESQGDYLLRTNSSLWPNSPMRLDPWGYASLEGIIFVDAGDILEFKYKIVRSIFGLGEPKFHHISLKVLYDANTPPNKTLTTSEE